MKKVHIFIPNLAGGGAEKVCVTLANYLVEQNTDVNLIVFNNDNQKYKENLNNSIKYICLDKEINKSLFRVHEYIVKNQVKRCISFHTDITMILILCRKIFRIDFEIITRNINTLSEEYFYMKTFKSKVKNRLIKTFYKNSDKFICQSKGMSQDLIDNYNVSKKKINIINNPISPMILDNSVYNYEIKEEKTILYIGRFEEQKGLEYLLDAFKIVNNLDSEIKLRMIGQGTLKNKIIDKVNKLELNDRVTVVDFSNSIWTEYQKATVVVLSSLFEGFPNVLVEAISLGTPVVSFDCPSGPSEIIIDDVNGYLVNYKDTTELAHKIYKAINKKWDYLAIKRTSERYNPDIILKKYNEIILS